MHHYIIIRKLLDSPFSKFWVQGKESYTCNKPWRPIRVGDIFGSDGDEVVSRPLPPGRFLVLISVRGSVNCRIILKLEGLAQLKNPLASLEIEPTTIWLVA
jgi:hypothetical protein